MSQSPDIRKNSDGGISDLQISGRSLIKENCHDSRISDDIDIKFGPVTKLDKRNKITLKKIDDDVTSANCDVIVIFAIYGQFGEIRKLDSRRIVCTTYIFNNSNVSKLKTELKNLKHSFHNIALSKGTIFTKKCKKNADISKIKEASVLKGIFSETTHLFVPTYQISSF